MRTMLFTGLALFIALIALGMLGCGGNAGAPALDNPTVTMQGKPPPPPPAPSLPAGYTIAFQRADKRGRQQICTMTGSTVTQLTNTTDTSNYTPTWSPTSVAGGPYIGFVTSRNGVGGFYRMKPDGTQVTLVKAGGYSYPDWSPTGDKVAFVRDYVAYGGSVTRVMVLDIATGLETWLTSAPTQEGWSYDSGPTFSPDGTTVAFHRGDSYGYELPGLYTAPATGGAPTTVLQTSSTWELDWGPALAGGHSLIAFRGVPGIQTVEMDETNTFVAGSLHTVCGSSPLLYAPEWSWDGAYLGGNNGSHVLYYLNANGTGMTSLVDGWWFSWKP